MLRINQSNLADDEDQVLDLYTEAIESFKKASALDPGKYIYINDSLMNVY
jgi:hypothetical protein